MKRTVAHPLSLALAGSLLGCSTPSAVTVSPGTEELEGKFDSASGAKVELKLTLEDPGEVRAELGLDAGNAEAREVWFYDTPALERFADGVILRGRRILGDDDDSTVKFRPLTTAEVDERWLALDGFKCEIDRAGDRSVEACSLTGTQGPGEVRMVGDGRRRVATLFTDDQEGFLAAHAPAPADLDGLTSLGPIATEVWKVESDDLDGKVTFESWILADGHEIVEVSRKVEQAEADDALDELEDWLADRDLAVGATQETKTRAALEALAARLAGST